jgi:hypothetical protein
MTTVIVNDSKAANPAPRAVNQRSF